MPLHCGDCSVDDLHHTTIRRLITRRCDDDGFERAADPFGHRRCFSHRADEGKAPGRGVADEAGRSDGRIAHLGKGAGTGESIPGRRR